jgi:hypothetical protein
VTNGTVVESINIVKDIYPGFIFLLVNFTPDTFFFQPAEKRLHNSIDAQRRSETSFGCFLVRLSV